MTNVQRTATLKYANSQRKDSNIYIITVTNEFGSDSAKIEAVVLGMCKET